MPDAMVRYGGFKMAARKLLKLRECAERSGFKESCWRSWILHRKVCYYKVGRSVRVAEEDLEKLIEEARIPFAGLPVPVFLR